MAPPGPDGLRDYQRPFFDPTLQFAADYGLAHTTLQSWIREVTNLSATQWYDIMRAEDDHIGVKALMRRELEAHLNGRSFREKRAPFLPEVLKELRVVRRERNWTALGRAWHWGYRYPQRLNLACFAATRKTIQELELAMLEEVLATWTWDERTWRISPDHGEPDPKLPAEVNAARAAAYAAGFARTPCMPRRGACGTAASAVPAPALCGTAAPAVLAVGAPGTCPVGVSPALGAPVAAPANSTLITQHSTLPSAAPSTPLAQVPTPLPTGAPQDNRV